MLKNRSGFTVSSCRIVDTIKQCTIRQIYICTEMAFFWSDQILAKVDAERTLHTINLVHTPKKDSKKTVRNRLEIRVLFPAVEQNRALSFFRQGKIQGKIQLLMALGNGS